MIRKNLPPGTFLGVMGGGQLGLMFALAARRIGFRTMIVDPDSSAPALKIADRAIVGSYDDPSILTTLEECCPAITTEFENVPAASLAHLEKTRVVRPSSIAVATCQDRISEKTFLRDHGFRTAPFIAIAPGSAIEAQSIGDFLPGILKSSREGYDGKGQWTLSTLEDLFPILQTSPGHFILEKKLDLKAELSVILGRSESGQVELFPVVENIHDSGILHYSISPARISVEISTQARNLATEIAGRLNYTGILSVEFFLDSEDRLYVNELAPRPHNSGHYTLDACMTSQFEQHVRVLAGLPLGSPDLLIPSVMGNLLGHLWKKGFPDFAPILSAPNAKLYLYGKQKARPGRKMGHFTVLDHDRSGAFFQARKILSALSDAPCL
jgi:5-(carboxyamino)imidazole ribonucleotide synthase